MGQTTGESMQIEYKKPEELTAYSSNSRTHSDSQIQQIKDSINQFGFTNPVLISEDNQLIAGHGRVQAALALNMDSIPTITLEGLTKTQQRALVIADNQLALNADWDLDTLKLEIDDLKLNDFDIDLLGFDDTFLGSIYDSKSPPDGFLDIDESDLEHTCPKCG